jgi:hypothetical protein
MFFQQVPLDNYNEVMADLAAKFEQNLKQQLAMPYPYAPGYNGGRKSKFSGTRNMKVKTGSLYNSIKVSFDPTSNGIKVMMLDYWQNVNDGREPGKYVPLKPLMEWIRTKGLNKNKKTGKFEKFSIKGTAFAISKTIKQFGIRPTNFYDDAREEFAKEFQKEAVQALGIDMQNFFRSIIVEESKKTK